MRTTKLLWLWAAILVVASGCGGGDSSPSVAVDIPANATFCSVFTGEYRTALANAVPITDAGFEEQSATISAWARVLRDLAPTEIAELADDNLKYHEAQANVESAADFIPGSNEMHTWANANC